MIILFVCLGVFLFILLIAAIVFVKVFGVAAAVVVTLAKVLVPLLIIAAIAFFAYQGYLECQKKKISIERGESGEDEVIVEEEIIDEPAPRPRRRRTIRKRK